MDISEFTCPDCGNNATYFKGFCPDCGRDSTYVSPDYCPECQSTIAWDPVEEECQACGYKMVEEEDKNVWEYITQIERAQTAEVTEENIIVWPAETFIPLELKAPSPYQPYFDYIKTLGRWPFIRVWDTDHWFNKLYSKWAGLFTGGIKVTHTPKAVGPFIFMPKSYEGTKSGYVTLRHEAQHAKDFWKFGILPFFLLQFLLPYGPSFTALFEYRGYCASLEAEKEAYGYIWNGLPESYANALAGKGYGHCFPWKTIMQKWFENYRNRLQTVGGTDGTH